MCCVSPAQVSGALNPDSGEGGSKAFQECVLARHPRHGEFAIAFITGRTVLQVREEGQQQHDAWNAYSLCLLGRKDSKPSGEVSTPMHACVCACTVC